MSSTEHAAMMRYGHLPGVDKPLSRLVQGTVMLSTREPERSFALLDAVFEQGCTTFDVAHVYGMGDVELAFGRWLRERGLRDQVVILGKGAHPYDGRSRVTPVDIASDLHESLERLGVASIDLYLLHRDDPTVPVGPLVEALNAHRRAGLIGAFGGSNWSHARIAEANAYATANGLTPFVASSPNFSLAEQIRPPWAGCLTISGPQGAAARAWYAEQRLPIFAWSSLAGGFLSGTYDRDDLVTAGDEQTKFLAASYGSEANYERLRRARALAAAHGASVAQVALAFVLHQPLDLFALVGAQSGAEFAACVAALQLALSDDELAWLDLRRAQLP